MVDNYVPEEDKVTWTVCRFRKNRDGGLYGMRAEHLQYWLGVTTREESFNPYLWDKIFGLIQSNFRKGHITEDFAWQTVLLIPQGNRDFREIGLMEVLWKTVTLDCRCQAEIQFHDTLHGFRTSRSTGIASFKSKLR